MHRSRLSSAIIDCNDLQEASRFWSGALGVEVASEDPPYVFLRGGAGGLQVGLQLVPEPKAAKSPVHLDFETDDLDAEVARLEALGARRQRFVEHWGIMEDPHGNEFCVVPRRPEEMPSDAADWTA
ncbi:MAG: VOC family protein [Chloroflexota bacterium]|nr:VOC family protein [Chloroflexota bacterium]